MSDELITIPDLVDEPSHFLIWQFDEVISIGIGLIVGLIFNAPIYGILAGIFIRSKYIRIRDGKPRGFIMHRLRELGVIPDKLPSKTEYGTSIQQSLVEKFYQ